MNDGTAVSNAAVVGIVVNDTPVALAGAFEVDGNALLAGTITTTDDAAAELLTFRVASHIRPTVHQALVLRQGLSR